MNEKMASFFNSTEILRQRHLLLLIVIEVKSMQIISIVIMKRGFLLFYLVQLDWCLPGCTPSQTKHFHYLPILLLFYRVPSYLNANADIIFHIGSPWIIRCHSVIIDTRGRWLKLDKSGDVCDWLNKSMATRSLITWLCSAAVLRQLYLSISSQSCAIIETS